MDLDEDIFSWRKIITIRLKICSQYAPAYISQIDKAFKSYE